MSSSNPFQGQHVIVLPVSNAKVRVRRPSLLTMVTVSGLPSELTSMAMKVANGKSVLEKEGNDAEVIKINFATIEAFYPYVLVDVKITRDGPTDVKEDAEGCWVGTVNSSDMADIDKQYLFMYGRHLVSANEPTTEADAEATNVEVGQFRDGGDGDNAGRSSEEIRPAPVESAGHATREPVVA